MIYLDANATEPLRPTARAAALAAMAVTGNASSVHGPGRAARLLLEEARESLARRFGASAAGVVFTSGGTEANALAVSGLGTGRRVIIGATEHDAVRAAAPSALIVPVDREGQPDLAVLYRMLGGGPALVCLMLANNETGTVFPIPLAASMCRAAGALLHVDAVQAAGRMTVELGGLGAHSLAVSGHKMGGLPGAGALLLAPGVEISAVQRGGGQERGRRGGTQALPAIVAMAAACLERAEGLDALRDAVETAAVACGAVVLGGESQRLANTTCLALPGVPAQTQVIALDLAGVAVSAGAACSSGKVARSHVLEAMGLGELAGEAIRVSLPWNARQADVEGFAKAYRAMVERLVRG